MAAGASTQELPLIRDRLLNIVAKEKMITLSRAKEVLDSLRGVRSENS